jgi:signal transduction histidine kinase
LFVLLIPADIIAQDRPVGNTQDTILSNPQEKLDQVILPFFTTKPDGNGIGLALSKHILYHQKGTISIESTPEKGTSVILEILFQK